MNLCRATILGRPNTPRLCVIHLATPNLQRLRLRCATCFKPHLSATYSPKGMRSRSMDLKLFAFKSLAVISTSLALLIGEALTATAQQRNATGSGAAAINQSQNATALATFRDPHALITIQSALTKLGGLEIFVQFDHGLRVEQKRCRRIQFPDKFNGRFKDRRYELTPQPAAQTLSLRRGKGAPQRAAHPEHTLCIHTWYTPCLYPS